MAVAVPLSLGAAACGDDEGTAGTSPTPRTGPEPTVSSTPVPESTGPEPTVPATPAPPFTVAPVLATSAAPSPGTEPGASPGPDPALDATSPPVDTAVADLAQRLGVDPATVAVVSARDVKWPDASLGCPEPGMVYAQVLTEGVLVVLEAGGRRYQYHAGPGRAPFLCESPGPPVGG